MAETPTLEDLAATVEQLRAEIEALKERVQPVIDGHAPYSADVPVDVPLVPLPT